MAQFKDIKIFNDPNYFVQSAWRDISYVIERYKERYNLEISPDFQRGYVWTDKQKVEYIEYVIKGGTSGKHIYFNQPGWMGKLHGNMVLVDGKQRLTTVLAFMNNEIPIFGGNYYKDYTDYLPSHCEFKISVNDLSSKKEVVEWYLAMNTGGTVHSTEDLLPAYTLLEILK